MLGYDSEEGLANRAQWIERLHPDDRDAVAQKIQTVLAEADTPYQYEARMRHADGSYRWISVVGRVLARGPNGKASRLLGVRMDITERKQNEAALRQGQAFNQVILDSVTAEIAVLDHNGIIMAVNQPWQRFAQENSGDSSLHVLVGANYLSVCQTRTSNTSEDASDAFKGIQAVLAGNLPSFNLEYSCHSPTQERWFAMSVTPLGADGGGVVVSHTNITERKAQQRQLKLAAQVFAQGREGIMVTDGLGHIVLANQAFTDITGYFEAEVLGQNPRLLSSGRESTAFFATMWESINTKDHWAGELWNRRKDGTVLRDDEGHTTHFVGSFSDLSLAKAAENRILWLSHFDSLTGLPNRALLQDRTDHAISMALRSGEPLTLLLVAIDQFKTINDAVGHQVGDSLLVEIAKRLGGSVRDQDTVARLGGKEFVILLLGTPSDGAAYLAANLLSKIAEPYHLGSHELNLTASIGISSYPDNGNDFETLLKASEIAMHRAQAKGRDTFQFYSEDMYQQVLARDHLIKALRNAAALSQLQVLYQPLVDLQTGQVSGMEALLRWHHPELGQVSPVQFIPLAEESGLIKGIGEWVLNQVCQDIRTWLDKGIAVPHVAVNVSPLQFNDADLVGHVKTALSGSRIDPKLVYLEVTESALMDDVSRSEIILKELKDLGVKLSLDDFGTGYSSLSYLKRFPFDKVKIDQSFVRDITTSQSDNVIVKVIVSMAHGLGLRVIAEGVETEAQCEIMRTHVCDEIQGYFFSRPISAPDIEALFTEKRQLPPHLLRFRKPQRSLLLVDDEPNVLASLKRLFRPDGHHILTASSGAEGLEILSRHKVDVIISDQRMPGMTGVEFLREAKIHYPDTIRIVLSGYTELQSVTDAINEGAIYRFLTKPWDDQQLREHIRKAFEYKELLEENLQLDIKIRTTNQELVMANRQLGDVLDKTRHQVERDKNSLDIVREVLQYVPLPVVGVDDEGLVAFVNSAAEALFASKGLLVGAELAHALPEMSVLIEGADEGVSDNLLIDHVHYHVQWNSMGMNSRSKGKIVMLNHAPGDV
jgi:diguanylate cyclase (GGDEF)-like protein/PAS domain S-box-containing protein